MAWGASDGETSSLPASSSSPRPASAARFSSSMPGRVAAVEQRRADRGSDAGVGDGTRHRARLPVHVPEPDGPGPDHLHAGQAGAPVDVLGGQLRLGRPDVTLQPLHQRQVVGVAAEEGHRRVRVAVDESGHDRGPAPVEDLVAVGGPHVGPDVGDHSGVDPQADRRRRRASPLRSRSPSGRRPPMRPRPRRRPSSGARGSPPCRPRTPRRRAAGRRDRWRGCRRRRSVAYGRPSSPAMMHSEATVMPITWACVAIRRISAGVSKRGPMACQ